MTEQEDIISMDNSGAHTDQKDFDEKTSQMSISEQKRRHASSSVQLEKTKLSRACPVCHGYKVHHTPRSALERWFSHLRPKIVCISVMNVSIDSGRRKIECRPPFPHQTYIHQTDLHQTDI